MGISFLYYAIFALGVTALIVANIREARRTWREDARIAASAHAAYVRKYGGEAAINWRVGR